MYNSHPKLSTLYHLNTKPILSMWFRLFFAFISWQIGIWAMRFACLAWFCSIDVIQWQPNSLKHIYFTFVSLIPTSQNTSAIPKMQQNVDSKCALGCGFDSCHQCTPLPWISWLLVSWDSNYPHLMLESFHPINATGWYFDKCTTYERR